MIERIHFIRTNEIVLEIGKVPFLSPTTLGWCRDLTYPLQPYLLSCMSLLFFFERPNRSTPKNPAHIWIPQVQEEGGDQTKLSDVVYRRSGVEMVLEVKRLDDFKKLFNVWVTDFRYALSQSVMCLGDKVGHCGKEVNDLV